MTQEREEYYIKLIKESCSFCEVCRKANIVATTGNYHTLKRIVKERDIDTSHFKRQNGGGKREKINIDDVLSNKRYITTYRLTKLLLKHGLKECKCENPKCGITEWQGMPLKVVPHHINGNHMDNRLENIMFLCPNCHSYTDNFGGKNIKIEKRFCQTCGKELSSNQKKFCSVECRKFHKKELVIKEDKINLSKCPSKNDLVNDISCLNLTKIGKKYGVSDKAVSKWLIKYNLPYKCKDITKFLEEKNITDKRYRKS